MTKRREKLFAHCVFGACAIYMGLWPAVLFCWGGIVVAGTYFTAMGRGLIKVPQ